MIERERERERERELDENILYMYTTHSTVDQSTRLMQKSTSDQRPNAPQCWQATAAAIRVRPAASEPIPSTLGEGNQVTTEMRQH